MSEVSVGQGRPWGESCAYSGVGKTQSHVAIGPRSPFACWLSAGGCSYLQEASLWSLHTSPATSQDYHRPSDSCHAAIFVVLCSQTGSPILRTHAIRLVPPDNLEPSPHVKDVNLNHTCKVPFVRSGNIHRCGRPSAY